MIGSRGGSTISSVDESPPSIVEVTGAVNGRFEVEQRTEDGALMIGPDTSLPAIMHRLDSRPATPDEFQATFGDLPTDE